MRLILPNVLRTAPQVVSASRPVTTIMPPAPPLPCARRMGVYALIAAALVALLVALPLSAARAQMAFSSGSDAPGSPFSLGTVQVPSAQAVPPAAAPPATAPPLPRLPEVNSGLLECRGEFATGTGFGSTRKVFCEFRPTGGVNHYYEGTLERVGLDFGVSDQASMLWAVLSTSPNLDPGALAGKYSGVTSGFSLGPGFSANLLAAQDPGRNVTLQPMSVSSDSGLSISLAAATLTLRQTGPRPQR